MRLSPIYSSVINRLNKKSTSHKIVAVQIIYNCCFLIHLTYLICTNQFNSVQFACSAPAKSDAIDDCCAQYGFYIIETRCLESLLSMKMFLCVIKHDFYHLLASRDIFRKNHHPHVVSIKITSVLFSLTEFDVGEVTECISINITRWFTKLNSSMCVCDCLFNFILHFC